MKQRENIDNNLLLFYTMYTLHTMYTLQALSFNFFCFVLTRWMM